MSFCDDWQTESDAASSAREQSAQLGAVAPSATGAALLTTLIAATGAKAAVEVGTGTGITGLAIVAGMAPDAILTTIDADASHQAAAKSAFRAAGIDSGRTRLITGAPAEVLPRLTDGGYDAVVINDLGSDPQAFYEQALRLLRTGGVMVITGALGAGHAVADPSIRDDRTTALRDLNDAAKSNENLTCALLPFNDGTILAVKTS